MLQLLIDTFVATLLSSLILMLLVFSFSSSPVEAQTCPGNNVGEPTVQPTSRTPGARTSYEVKFVTPEVIGHHTGSIVMVLHEDIQVPRSISPSNVRVQYQTAAKLVLVSGFASDVFLGDQENHRRPTTINIAHDLGDNDSQVDIPCKATVTVTFTSGAGITNPTERGSYAWKVGVGSDSQLVDANHPEDKVQQAFRTAFPDSEDTGLLVDREVQLNRKEGNRGQSVTVTARGYRAGRTLTVWRDANVDGQRDSGERVLCEVVVGSDGVGRCNFTVFVPPFVGGFGECVAEPNLDCNFINAAQGFGGSSVIIDKGTNRIYEADQAFELLEAISKFD